MANQQIPTEERKERVPLFHIAKRATMPWYKAWAVRAIAIAAAFLFIGLVSLVVLQENPIQMMRAIFEGVFGSSDMESKARWKMVWSLLSDTSILLLIALALTPAFKMKFWNIGAEGQVLIGALCSALCMFYIPTKIPSISNWMLILIMLVAGMLGGILWASGAAVCKAIWGTNETLFTLMMNYVATCIVLSFLAIMKGANSALGMINRGTRLGWLPEIGTGAGKKDILIVLVVAVITCVVFVYMRYSKHGYEISVVGESENTARYVGINVKKVIIRTIVLSGALCGLTGFLLVSASAHTLSETMVGGDGFTAIMVAWLAKFNPIFMFFASLLISFLKNGAGNISNVYPRINASWGDIIVGVILFFIIGCEFFINYQICFRKKRRED